MALAIQLCTLGLAETATIASSWNLVDKLSKMSWKEKAEFLGSTPTPTRMCKISQSALRRNLTDRCRHRSWTHAGMDPTPFPFRQLRLH
jgi:hypothetical protein